MSRGKVPRGYRLAQNKSGDISLTISRDELLALYHPWRYWLEATKTAWDAEPVDLEKLRALQQARHFCQTLWHLVKPARKRADVVRIYWETAQAIGRVSIALLDERVAARPDHDAAARAAAEIFANAVMRPEGRPRSVKVAKISKNRWMKNMSMETLLVLATRKNECGENTARSQTRRAKAEILRRTANQV